MKTIQTFCKLTQKARALLPAILVGLLGASPLTVPAETISDLLEQGIYSEETKGDLDEAVRLYQQVIQESESNEALAARAQYRLGVCYWKKKEYEEAAAAFEKILNDYPQQKELVRMASEYLTGAVQLLPAPWLDGEVMRLTIKTATGFEIGFVRYSVHSATSDGQAIWRLNSQLVAGPKQVSQVDVVADSFRPLHCRWKHSMFGDADIDYGAGIAKVQLAGKDESQTAELSGVVYDNEQVIELIRRLPLAPDYAGTLQVFTGLGGARVLPIETKVMGMEKVEVPAGTFECYKVYMKLVNQTFWYSADEHRYLVKFEAGGITAELTGVEQLTAREIEKQAADAFNFELGDATGGVPSIEARDAQSLQKQAKMLVMAAGRSGKALNRDDWCDVLKANSPGMPELDTKTCLALNSAVAGRAVTDLPADTVVFFEIATAGWNQTGGVEMAADNSQGVAVGLADGRVLVVDPHEISNLRWNP